MKLKKGSLLVEIIICYLILSIWINILLKIMPHIKKHALDLDKSVSTYIMRENSTQLYLKPLQSSLSKTDQDSVSGDL